MRLILCVKFTTIVPSLAICAGSKSRFFKEALFAKVCNPWIQTLYHHTLPTEDEVIKCLIANFSDYVNSRFRISSTFFKIRLKRSKTRQNFTGC